MASPTVDPGAFSSGPVGPTMPLRRPSTGPRGAPSFLAAPRLLSSPSATGVHPVAGNLANGAVPSMIQMDDSQIGSPAPAMIPNLCNYCSKQGTFRCNGCQKTFYCSALCHNEDWKAHRHLCLSHRATPEGEKAKEVISEPLVNGPSQTQTPQAPEVKPPAVLPARTSDASLCHSVYLVDLERKKIAIGSEVQALVVEVHSPGRFFVHVQSCDVVDSLRTLSKELEITYGGTLPAPTYSPAQGEVCAVQYSMDMKWYRGLVQSIVPDQKTASVLYIDFGNEEEVIMARIRPLDPNIRPIGPCATECCVAGAAPVTGIWTGDCCLAVKQLLTGRPVTLSVVDVTQSGRVHSVDFMISALGKRLSTFLVEQGYAIQADIAAKPSEKDIHCLVSASLDNFKRLSTGTDENTEARPPEPLTQAVGDSFSAVVTQVRSPLDMICQKVENANVIQELQMGIRDHCSQSPASLNFRPAPGTVCCSQFSDDNQWYRAQVLAYSSEDRVCVGYIDFGNSEEVELGRLRPLSTPLLALPMQAIPCALAGVQPIQEAWDDECVLVLQQMVCNRILSVRIVGRSEGTALVVMADHAGQSQANVAELLISAGYAAPAAGGPDRVATVGAAPPAAEGAAAVANEESGSAPDSLVWSSVELPCGGPMVALMVSFVVNPGDFFCCKFGPEVGQRLLELAAELKVHCEGEASACQATAGRPCCARFPDDNCWYRVMVKEVYEDKVLVNFVDYGNSAEMKKVHLRSITAPLLALPFQAIPCWLAGVEPQGPAWPGEALHAFHAMVSAKQLSGRTLQLTERGHGVELASGGQDVASALLAQKLARPPGGTAAAAASPPTCPDAHRAPNPSAAKGPEAMQSMPPPPEEERAKGPPREEPAKAEPAPAASFPVDWKTAELPRERFRPCVAAVTSPTLFYVLSPTRVEAESQQRVMTELAKYCSTGEDPLRSSSFPVQQRPWLGAACCALFSGDKNWYRAVVLETGESEARVLFVDYGNCETVPYASLRPIPAHLLQQPFQITRCSLTGKERFPSVCPADLLQLFRSVLGDNVTATVLTFDGYTNQLAISLPAEMGGGRVDDFLLSQLELLAPNSVPKEASSPTNAVGEPGPQPSTPTSLTTTTTPTKVLVERPTPAATTTTPSRALGEHLVARFNATTEVSEAQPTTTAIAPEDKPRVLGERPWPAKSNKGPEGSGCCCNELKDKMDRLEQLLERQISVIKEMVGLANR